MNIVFFIVTLIAFKILASILGGITRRAVSTMKRTSDLLRHFFVNTVRNITFLIGVVVALSMIGIDVGPVRGRDRRRRFHHRLRAPGDARRTSRPAS